MSNTDRDVRRLRAEVDALGPGGRGRRIPSQLRLRLVAAAKPLRRQGLSLTAVADRLGVTAVTIQRWCSEEPRANEQVGVVPVHLQPSAQSPCVVVSPDGWRVEGLSVQEAASLLKAVS